MINAVRHQNIDNAKIKAGIRREIEAIPKEIVKRMVKERIPYPYLIHETSHFNFNFNLDVPNNGRLPSTVTKPKGTIDGFEDFWSVYPKKVGKQECVRWWLRRTITPELVKQIIDSVNRYKQTKQWQDKIIPNPLTYLNRGSWEDVIETHTKAEEFKSYAAKK
jgi:hypothetical protein